MSAAYVTNTKRNVRTVEAYRVMSLGQDMTVERESQLIALME
ncbi:GGDEF domain-containing protein [Acetobacter orientalis]|nr:GGDEF domain-containing protein [Acetobacter orientalis]